MTNLNVKVLVDFDDVTEQVDVLHEVGKFPHVAQLVQHAGFLGWPIGLHFLAGPLSRSHVGGACRARRRVKGEANWNGSAATDEGGLARKLVWK